MLYNQCMADDKLKTLYKALCEPISEVDAMNPEQVRKYLTANGLLRCEECGCECEETGSRLCDDCYGVACAMQEWRKSD